MDGVIVDSAHPHYKSWKVIFGKFGLKYPKSRFEIDFGKTTRQIIEEFLNENGFELGEKEINLLDYEKEEVYRDLIKKEGIQPFAGAVELIRSCKEVGFKVAIASSGPSQNIKTVVDVLKINDFIDVITSGMEVEHGKPHPEIFLRCAQRLGVDPSECVVIEDALWGVKAAKSAGMFCIAVTNTVSKEELKEADLIVDTLADTSILKFLMSPQLPV
jgi:beta-phosphoglucomutase